MPKLRLAVALALVLFACTRDKPIEPPNQGGSFSLTFSTPNTDDGALFFELHGPGITAIQAADTGVQLFADSNGTTIRGAMVGQLHIGAVATFDVPDTTRRADYTASVLDVAGTDNNLRVSLNGYALRVEP
jgi:hypothetical protein